MPTKIEGQDEAQAAYEANLSARACELLELERYVDGTQYAGLKDWFDDAPIWERAPCIVYPSARNAIDANIDMLLGDGRHPKLTTRPDEDETGLGVEGLGEDDSASIDRFVRAAMNEALFWVIGREAFRHAQIARSSATLWSVRAGRLCGKVMRARWCAPEFEPDEATVSRLVVEYPYVENVRTAHGVRAEARMFRRVIDAQADTTYYPQPLTREGAAPVAAWQPDPQRTAIHGLGFCPVVWYPHMRGPTAEGAIDGVALHEGVLDEIKAHDYALSQRHRAALYAGDPQWTETGVDDGHNPAPAGPPAGPNPGFGGVWSAPKAGDKPTGAYRTPTAKQGGRRKGVGSVWTYPDAGTRVELHTLPGDALKAVTDNADALRAMLCESMAVVFLDAETVKFAATLSGKAMEALRRRQLDRCNQYRDDFGEHWIRPSAAMLLRIARQVGARGDGALLTPGVAKALPILARFGDDAAVPL